MTTQNHFRRKTLIGFAFLLILTGIGCFFAGRYAGAKPYEFMLAEAENTSLEALDLRQHELREIFPEYTDKQIERLSKSIVAEKWTGSVRTKANYQDDPNKKMDTISVDHVKWLRSKFDTLLGRLFEVDVTPDEIGGHERLNGWNIDLDVIKSLQAEPPAGWHKAKTLLVVPVMAPKKNSLGEVIPSSDYTSLIIAPVDSNNYIIYKDNNRPELYEYLKPCPDNCPKNYNAVFK